MGLDCASVIYLLCFLVVIVNAQRSADRAYKPVVIVHGIWDKRTSLDFMANRIREVWVKVASKRILVMLK